MPICARTCSLRGGLPGLFAALLVVAAAPGCLDRTLAPLRPCTTARFEARLTGPEVDEVDLLLMIDDSGSMEREQALLARELPRMVALLASGDRDDDGEPDFTPVRSLHVGVVTSDLGAGPELPADVTLGTCRAGFGDDGVLRATGGPVAGCSAAYPPVFDFARGDDPAEFAAEVACVGVVGTGGCGFEQQLEAALKALSPSVPTPWVASDYVPPVFAGGTVGHGDGENDGFLRERSALALVLVTDEEDCSVPDYSLFYRGAPYSGVSLNLRCHAFPERLYPVSRYVDGFLQLRENPALLVYAGIAGIPTDLVGSSVEAYDAMLADPRVEEHEDTSTTPAVALLPSCTTADGGRAAPPRRMIEVARGLELGGAGTTMQSICAGDFRPAVDRVVALISEALGGACVPRPLHAAADGSVDCEVVEVLPTAASGAAVTRCSSLGPLAEHIGDDVDPTNGGLRERCRIRQLLPPEIGGEGAGWFYDVGEDARRACGGRDAVGQRIAFQRHHVPLGTDVRFSCALAVLAETDGSSAPLAQIGTFCEPGREVPGVATDADPCPGAPVPSRADVDADGAPDRLSCDDVTRTCVVRCRSDADCASAGRLGDTCDLRSVADVTDGAVPAGVDGDRPYAVCVSPTCG